MKTAHWLTLGLLVALIVVIVVLAIVADLSELLDPRGMRRMVRDAGVFGPLAFVLVMALARMFFVPGLPLVIAGGLIFGWMGGFALSLIGEMIGATAAFLFARHLGRDFVRRRFIRHHEHLQRLDEQLGTHGIKAVVMLRLFNVLPFTPFDIALGLTRVQVRKFLIGTLIGVTPGTLVASYLGEAIYELQVGRIVAGVLLLVVLGMLPLIHRRRPRRE